ncbi:hypothetical protein G9464_20260 [Halostella sp. JP-L12]|uniref:DUF7520 family protein n=1 Tax=Halostella TaxID=1843185 RepID=UPI000EF8473C|nr:MULTISPECIES: hypothetical protein [Halostella]NHN49906.1 hypothetical protein [Halostella sp. JP-L12]
METSVRGRIGGRRMVLGLYAAIVGLAALFGAMVGLVLPVKEGVPDNAGFGPFVFEITPLNFAVYGAVMVGLSLGVILLLMALVSDRYPDA